MQSTKLIPVSNRLLMYIDLASENRYGIVHYLFLNSLGLYLAFNHGTSLNRGETLNKYTDVFGWLRVSL